MDPPGTTGGKIAGCKTQAIDRSDESKKSKEISHGRMATEKEKSDQPSREGKRVKRDNEPATDESQRMTRDGVAEKQHEGELATHEEVANYMTYLMNSKLHDLNKAVAKRSVVYLLDLDLVERLEFDKEKLRMALSRDRSVRQNIMDIFLPGRDARLITIGTQVLNVDDETNLKYGHTDGFTKEHLAALRPCTAKESSSHRSSA